MCNISHVFLDYMDTFFLKQFILYWW